MTDYSIGYVVKEDKAIINYSLYSNFMESKMTLLSIMGAAGLEMMESNEKQSALMVADHAIKLMALSEREMKDDDPTHMILDFVTPVMIFFIKRGDGEDLKAFIKAMGDEDKIEMKLLADHRKCTPDFCYSSLSTDLN